MALTLSTLLLRAFPISRIDQGEHFRTIWDVLLSCLAVSSSCTWVAYHPDIPPPGASKSKIYIGRGLVLVSILFAPEIAIAMAVSDFIVARKWAEEYKEYKWTLTHGFFAKMGGFVLYDDDAPPQSLHPSELRPYLHRGEICVTAEEIQGKSKGDALARVFVLFQITWFILQFFARDLQKLPITELELATLSFPVLNCLTFAIWWRKPLRIDSPIPVYKGMPAPQFAVRSNSSRGQDEDDPAQSNEKTVNPGPAESFSSGSHADGERDGGLMKLGDIALDFLDKRGYLVPFSAGTIFGTIHCSAWSYHFPTLVEKIIWLPVLFW